ncbi:protein-L-isoaspartate(D-aspartate) O-methyltransferase [Gammaproteobacteria bacterium]|nr:protein-L-isoaspartate(D-aspartate) O-methyltransferase [Gammaproteobacteria bacterium]
MRQIPGGDGIGFTSSRTRSRLVQRLRQRGINHEAVLHAFEALPRHRFLEEAMAHRAYDDDALPIGFGQTISQPYVVARMTELALGDRSHVTRILDVGTGCGYQAAVLSRFCDYVYSIERIEPLSRRAQATLRELRIRNVVIRHGDGFAGWEVRSPFDAIVAAAAPNAVPAALVEQLAIDGRLVIPVGGRSSQQLRVIINRGDRLEEQLHDKVIFVPMTPGTR